PLRRGLARPRPALGPGRGRLAPRRRGVQAGARRPVSGRYLSLTERDREEMLATIGVSAIEELFADVPDSVRFRGKLQLEPALSEPELVAHLEELASRNAPVGSELSFLGAGVFDHHVPATVEGHLS